MLEFLGHGTEKRPQVVICCLVLENVVLLLLPVKSRAHHVSHSRCQTERFISRPTAFPTGQPFLVRNGALVSRPGEQAR